MVEYVFWGPTRSFKIMHYITHKIMQLLSSYFFWQISTRNIEFVPLCAINLNPTQLKKQHKLLKISSILNKIQRNLMRPFAKGIDIVDLNFDLKCLWRLYTCLKLLSLTVLRFKAVPTVIKINMF